jgi:23S rRNA pseudouridine1911/1915/1917 synthase
MQKLIFEVASPYDGYRIDLFLSEINSNFTRSFVKKQITDGNVFYQNKTVKPNQKIKVGEIVSLHLQEPQAISTQPENIPIDIVYEDNDIVVINKAKGMVVHPAPGNYSGTLVNALLYHCTSLSGINGEVRPGIVHRIDKNTSGLLVVAKNDQAHQHLSQQIQNKTAGRIYWALAHGKMKQDTGTINQPIARDSKDRKLMSIARNGNGRHAVTNFAVIQRYEKYTLVELSLETGRTHQIRVHLKYLGHPIVGDPEYGLKKKHFNLSGQLLHAKKLLLVHPVTKQQMEFYAELPEDFNHVLEKIKMSKI